MTGLPRCLLRCLPRLRVRPSGRAAAARALTSVLAFAAASLCGGIVLAAGPSRVEARSAHMLAVGVVQNDRMSIRVSRLLDNAPLRDAVVTVALRGASHSTVAEADGSYTMVAKDLTLPGAAAVEFQVAEGRSNETLKGVLAGASADAAPDEKGTTRQMWWWALNFGVCIGFLVLFSRRKKSAPG